MKPTTLLFVLSVAILFGLVAHSHGQAPAQPAEALTGFDDQSNGFSDPDRRKADQKFFEEVEHIAPDGLGPLYNAQSCRECHQTPVSGASSQVTELRVGHLDAHGLFQNPRIPINHDSEVIQDRTLVNDRTICAEIQEHAPSTETVRTTRLTTNILGDGYVEAISDETLLKIRKHQCQSSHGKICGQAVKVPVPESEGRDRVGRFGWKDQHASLLAFAADAYLNEMGITNRLQKTEVTAICSPRVTTSIPNNDPTKITEPNSLPDPTDNNLEDIDHFASFMRSLKAPAPDEAAAANLDAKHGAELFRNIGCVSCHVETIVTGKARAVLQAPACIRTRLRTGRFIPIATFFYTTSVPETESRLRWSNILAVSASRSAFARRELPPGKRQSRWERPKTSAAKATRPLLPREKNSPICCATRCARVTRSGPLPSGDYGFARA